jgi:predicted porin
MKKSLIALAALSAFATAAQAQSSVTIYGILDTGYRDSELKLSAGADNASLKSRDLGFSNQQTSRFGIRGSEDLGGGLRAGFQLEAGMSLDSSGSTGSVAATTGNATGATSTGSVNNVLGSRPTFVSLTSAKLGEVRVGRQDTSLHASVGRFNTGGQNNMPGSIYSPFASTLLIDDANANSSLDLLATSGASVASLGSYARTVDKVLSYTTNVINGFQAQLMVGDGKDDLSAVDGSAALNASQKRKHTSYSLAYKVGNFDVGYGYHQSKTDGQAVATLNSATALAAAALAKVTTEHIGASYNFGVAQAFAQYITNKSESATATTYDNEATEVGVRVPMGTSHILISRWPSQLELEMIQGVLLFRA